MPKTKITVSIDQSTLGEVDQLVALRTFPSHTRIIEEALQEKLSRMYRNLLARECAKLDHGFEKAMAEEGLGQELLE
ncbi:ribbon-helix-helix protein, CopG family [uncultured Desulfuromonas sp.]|uniref:ribbon-helix-helix protein, CopG family n=1 Tax=uncultured Desulfuromonas sp. TaxID=181013 RepID=UPI0026041070|nr:ribbon-helix-helix protein, CopG family [uncultured Desulfuromonas sp.]